MKQQDMLRKLVTLAHPAELPFSIHCHDSKLSGDEYATNDCIQILASHQEKCYPIYLHCFNEGVMEHQTWINHFHNVHFGIRPLILDSTYRYPQLIGIACQIDVAHLLLESDVPYFRDSDSSLFGTS